MQGLDSSRSGGAGLRPSADRAISIEVDAQILRQRVGRFSC
jgi:hypothetical protein